ncbi:MAG: response regulator [Ignavibacteriales bacterium]|nr:MAG: response regulator [Ignavibacteriales bacterium]
MKKEKILIIEDEGDIRDNIRILLELENYETATAINGKEGVRKAKEFLPDLIICDIMMPGIDGYEVLDELTRNKRTSLIPFIFLTAKVELSDLRKGMSLGADDYIFKPFNSSELLQAIRTRLNKFSNLVATILDGKDNNNYTSTDIQKKVLNERFFISYHNTSVPVALKKIICIIADNQYSKIICEENKNYLLRKSLNEWEKILPSNQFVRIHRSTIMSWNHIDKIEKRVEGKYFVLLKDSTYEFEISRRFIKKVKQNYNK